MAQRYQREIEEILGAINEDPPTRTDRRKASTVVSQSRETKGRLRRITPGRLLLAGLALLIAALLMNAFGLALASPLAWLGVALSIIAYVAFFTKPRRLVERRWRGQLLDDPPATAGISRFWRWISKG